MAEYNFLNDITKFGSNALSAANTLQRQVRAWATEQVEYLIKSAELITKEELVAHGEAQNVKIAELSNRIAQLEKIAGVKAEAAPATEAVKKPVAKKIAVKVAPKVAAKKAK